MKEKEKVKEGYTYPKVRELTRKDRVKLSELIKLFAERSGSIKLTGMLPGQKGKDKKKKDDTDQIYALIKSLMQQFLDFVEEELTTWFMELIDVTDRDAYDNMPFDIELRIIDQLMAQEGFDHFFTRAWEMYRKIPG